MFHPQECGPCEDCAEALVDYATIPAYRQQLQSSPYRFENMVCAGTFAREITYGYGYPTKANYGKVISVPPATPERLERHRKLYGKDGVQLPDEQRSVNELRDSGMSIGRSPAFVASVKRGSRRNCGLRRDRRRSSTCDFSRLVKRQFSSTL